MFNSNSVELSIEHPTSDIFLKMGNLIFITFSFFGVVPNIIKELMERCHMCIYVYIHMRSDKVHVYSYMVHI